MHRGWFKHDVTFLGGPNGDVVSTGGKRYAPGCHHTVTSRFFGELTTNTSDGRTA
jgi:hypothetical protein